jgi:PAS domain S-box-containing protein
MSSPSFSFSDPPVIDAAAQALLDMASEPLFLADLQGRIVFGNAAWRDWMHRHGGGGGELTAAVQTRQPPQDGEPAQQAPSSGQDPDGAPLVMADGSRLHLRPWRGQDGRAGWLGRIAAARGPAETGRGVAPGLVQRLEMTQDFGRLAVWERSLDGRQAHWDEHMFRVYGLAPQPQPPDPDTIRELIHPEDRERVLQAWQASIRSPGAYHLHYRLLPRTGGVRVVHSLWRVLADAQGRPDRVLGVLVDDTESFERGVQVRKLSAQFELAVELAKLIIWVHDPATDELRVNERAAALLGVPERVTLPLEDVRARVHEDDRQALAEGLQRVLDGEDAVDVVARYRDAQGVYRTLLTRRAAQRDETGRVVAVLGVAMDITERRNTELALQQAQARAALATREAGIGTWERDLRTGTSHWDAQMYLLRGLSPDDPRPVEALRVSCVHPDDRAAMWARYDQVRAGALDRTAFEFRVVWPDGSEHWLATRGHVLRDESGQPVRMLGVNWDITELKRTEQALREKAAAEQASRAKSEFLARMSHELRTPLNAVLGFAQVLQADAAQALSPAQRQRVDHIHAAGRHLLALIEDMLDLARIESGTVALRPEALDVRAVVADALGLVVPMARAHGVELHTGSLAGLVQADRQRLRQVLMNLLSNAIKYNRPGGRVEVAAHGAADWLTLVVRDTGRGMSREQVQGLFEPFNRLGVEREGIEGTGIGLSIARQLVTHMGGRIEVRSRVGEGSEFEVWLPRALQATCPAAGEAPVPTPPVAPQPQAEPAQPALELLYIEDNEVNVTLVREVLALRPAVRLSVAGDGAGGVALAHTLQPDAVLVDMHLPDVDGHEVLRRLQADPRTAALPCIALSANAMPEDVQRALAAGFVDYWTKPIDVARFLAAIDRMLAARAGREG